MLLVFGRTDPCRACLAGRAGGLGVAGRAVLWRWQLAGTVLLRKRRDVGVGEFLLGRRRDLRRRLDAADLPLRLGDLRVAGVREGRPDLLPLGGRRLIEKTKQLDR